VLTGYRARSLFTVTAMVRWYGMPTNAVESASVEVFSTWLDKALNNLVCLIADPVLSRRLE